MLATAGHGLLLLAQPASSERTPPSVQTQDLELEFDLDAMPAEAPSPVIVLAAESPVAKGRSQLRAETVVNPASTAPNEGLPEASLESGASPEQSPPTVEASPQAKSIPGRKVRLFLAPSELAELTRAQEPLPEAKPPSPGLLVEGLLEQDAEKGLSRSSQAVSASRRAAELGPEEGTAVLELRVDAEGHVTNVTVIGGAPQWSKVAADVLARLQGKKLKVPAGSKGMLARLRIDRGSLAEEPGSKGRVERGAALGQEHHARDYGWNESTQAGGHGDRMAPTLGVSSEMLRHRVKSRIRLLSEQAL